MNRTRPSLTAILALGLWIVLSGCHRNGDQPPARQIPVPVRVQTVESKKHLTTEEVVGTVRAKLRAGIEAKVSGRIEQMPVVAGQTVKKDELLAQLDVREVQARLDQAQAVLRQAQQDRGRFETLLQQKTVTQQEYDAFDARYRVAAASVAEAETMLSYARVAAPFAGVVSRKIVDVGDFALPGRVLLELEDPKLLQLEADVPEALIGHVTLGASMPVHVATVTNEFQGIVSEVAPAADPNSRTFRVKLDLPAVAGLRLGQFARVAVPVSEATSLRVPVSAVIQRGQMELVFVVADQMGRLRLVKTGKRLGDEIEILSGLNAGEPIVTEGAASLLDGQPVEVKR